MMNIYKRTSRIENFFSMFLTKAGLSENLFFGNLPAIIESEWEDMVLVDVLKTTDYDAYAQGTVNIYLYSKSTDNLSKKPVKALYRMETELDAAINSVNDNHYSVEVEWRDNGYDDSRNYYYDCVNVSVTVRTI